MIISNPDNRPIGELRLKLYEIIWKERFVEKIADKHGVATEEVEEVLFSRPHVRLAEKGRIRDAHLYVAYGQTQAGRYLIVLFIRKSHAVALPIPAGDMTKSEQRYYRAPKEAD
jgi:uncharacterized DUF497 family protein